MSPLLSPEARLLVLALRPDSSAELQATLADPGLDWSRLVWLAEKEKATTVLWQALRRLPAGQVAPDRAAHLSRLARVSEFRMLHLEHLLGGVLDVLTAQGIEVVLLKGAGLAASVYGSFAARPMYDLDLLVQPSDARQAWLALRHAGWLHKAKEFPPELYEQHHHLPPLDEPTGAGFSVELHTEAGASVIGLSSAAIRGQARRIEVLGRKALVPSAEHLVLHLAVHFAWNHSMTSAGWRSIRDLQQLVAARAFAWESVIEMARATRAETSCYWTFRLARALAGVPVPDAVLHSLQPPRPAPALRILERHFIGSLFRFGPNPCPSVRLTRFLWTAGMSPRWSGHGAIRPWHGLDRGRHINIGVTQPNPAAGSEAAKPAAWARYLGALFNPSRGGAGDALEGFAL